MPNHTHLQNSTPNLYKLSKTPYNMKYNNIKYYIVFDNIGAVLLTNVCFFQEEIDEPIVSLVR